MPDAIEPDMVTSPSQGYVEVSVSHKELAVEYRVVYAKNAEALVKYCLKRGLLAVYGMLAGGGATLPAHKADRSDGDPLSGFTVCHQYTAVSEDGKRGVIYILVSGQEKHEELRTWAHEISHAVDFTADILARAHPGVTEKMRGELKATCAELLADTVRILTTGNLRTETPMSQFPCALARAVQGAHGASDK